jgi:sigma-B regulation protein RsbU (phosphoserine phosphatase)
MSKTTIRISFLTGILIILVLSIYNLSIVGSQVSDENLYVNRDEGVIIIEISTGGVSEAAGLQVGDRLVMINGDSVRSSYHAQTYLDNAKAGESLVYTIERDGKIFDITVNLALLGLRIWYVAIITCGIMFLLFSAFVLFLKPDKKYARLLALATMLLGFLLINIQIAANPIHRPLDYQILVVFIIASGFLAIALFSHAMLYFPEQKYKSVNRFWMIYSHYILAGFWTLVSCFIVFIRNSKSVAFFVVPLLYFTAVELINWKKRRREYVARQKIIKMSGVLHALVFILGIIIGSESLAATEYLAFVFCSLPIAFFYTTVRYRVFDINVRIKLSLIYTIIQFLIFIVFIFAVVLIVRLLPLLDLDLPAMFITGSFLEFRSTSQLDLQSQQHIQVGYLLFIGISLVLILYISKNKLQNIIDKIFFQQKYDYRRALKQFGELLSSTFNKKDISQKSVEQIHDILKVKGTSLAFPQNDHYKFTTTIGNMEELHSKRISIPNDIIESALQSRMQIRPDQFTQIDIFENMENLIDCGTPIISAKNRLEGILFTGEKLSESAYNHDDLELLSLFAENLGAAFERARLYEEKAEKERLSRELEIAREIQLNSLPKYDPDYRDLEICSSLASANEVGGDYYDYLEIDDSHLGIIIGDVVGKGTSGAIHMSKIQGFLKTLQLENQPSEKMFGRLNTLIRKNFDSDFFFTALYGLFDLKLKQATIYRLGHNGLIYYDSENNEIKIIEPSGIAFGIANTEPFKKEISAQTIQFHKGDLFVFLTDGFTEAMNESNELFGEQRASELIAAHSAKTANQIMEILQRKIREFSNGIAHDDATGVIVKIIDT